MAETREIPLTKGYVTIVDAADYEWLSQWKWRVMIGGHANSTDRYAARNSSRTSSGGVQKPIMMHRVLLGLQDPISAAQISTQKGDHRNGNGLDNRRDNLRPSTHAQNTMNRRKVSALPYKGISVSGKGFKASVRHNDKYIYGGQFATAEEAARAYDALAIEHFGEFALLNFPANQTEAV